MPNRNGKRKTREQLAKRRIPSLGYYFIVTDTEETERNYFNGLRDSIPKELQGKLVIKVSNKTKDSDLVNEVLEKSSQYYQYCEPWIVFDRDQVKNFDKIISDARAKDVKVGWSNPCIEIWFSAYLGDMPTYPDSVSCCEGFAKKYEQVTGQKYKKSDTAVYQKLCRHGDEKKAVDIAERRFNEHLRHGNDKPSKMCPCTTVHTLIKEITEKVSSSGQ